MSEDAAILKDLETVSTVPIFGRFRCEGRYPVRLYNLNDERGAKFCAKSIPITNAAPSIVQSLLNEGYIMYKLRNSGVPNILRAWQPITTKKYVHLIMERMQNDLLEFIMKCTCPIPETDSQIIIRRIVDCVAGIHRCGYVHGDLKLENVLCSFFHYTDVFISDFGLSQKIDPDIGYLTKSVGTDWYIAPEIRAGERYSFPVDIWNIGIILYILSYLHPPFDENGNGQLILRHLNNPEWPEPSYDIKKLITRCLDPNPERRWTIEQLQKHPWISKDIPMSPDSDISRLFKSPEPELRFRIIPPEH